jgi:copper(I)-binding protein
VVAADRLVRVTTPLTPRVTIHSTSLEGGVARMEERPDGVSLPKDRAQTFRAGGDHIMLIAPNRALAEGETIPLTLTFEKAPPITVQAAVRLSVQ